MKAVEIYFLLNIILTASVLVNSFDPIDIFKSFWQTFFTTGEICDSPWISFDTKALKVDLDKKLFGQHIATRIILTAVNGFMSDENPRKPLVLSLHGWSGTGKSFVSQLIAENIFKEGINSRFVHVFISTYHFQHKSKFETYKTQLQQWIKGNVTSCARSMFIFDEMDKMHPGLIDSIKPFLGYHSKLDGVSFRQTIFIFISNAGADIITQTALEFVREGRHREELELHDLETSLSESAFNNIDSGLWHSSLIDANLVDFFVPFLPLEYGHVVQCVMAEMEARDLWPDKNAAHALAKDTGYIPKVERVFSIKGCKGIRQRLYYYI